jgi:ABC-type transport system involved in cytochrome c biogenesis ATPase subunit
MLTANKLACERGERLLFKNMGFELGRGEALLVVGGQWSGHAAGDFPAGTG